MRDLSYEHEEYCFFCTTRTMNSRLWFINNPKLEERILAYLAKYQEVYGVVLYAFVLMGNHYHLVARFPRGNKAAFFQAFNGIIAKLVARHCKEFDGGKLWARRVRCQAVPRDIDIEMQFFYAALNPVHSGLARRLREYRSYNSFGDAVYERKRKFTVVKWQEYYNRKRFNSSLTPKDFETTYTLHYTRLPGYEQMTRSKYIKLIHEKLEARRIESVNARLSAGKGFATPQSLKAQIPGSAPRTTKSAKRETHRPLVLTLCMETKTQFLDWYFSMLHAFREASKRFREGFSDATFPPGTYLPHKAVSLTG